jgi:hypothetical protein
MIRSHHLPHRSYRVRNSQNSNATFGHTLKTWYSSCLRICFAWSIICLQIYLKSYRLQSNEWHPHGIPPLTVAHTEVCRYFWYSSGFVSVSLRSGMEIVTGRDLWLLIYRFCIWHWRRDYFCWLVWCGCLVFVLQDSYRLTESEVFQVMTLAKLYSFSSNKWLLFKADTSATEVSARSEQV